MHLIIIAFIVPIFVTCIVGLDSDKTNCEVRDLDVHFNGSLSVNLNKIRYCSFLGIPYAEPPIGKLRFEPPQPVSYLALNGRNFNQRSNVCLQPHPNKFKVFGSEDCLYLNVFSPQLRPAKLMPVFVWIHGGSMNVGSAFSDNVSPDFFVEQQIVFVTFNFRLGALGFLSLPRFNITGNYGLFDQQLALQWVKSNIAVFGGDPSRVTVVGWSAGAASVTYHLYALPSKGLFQQAIVMSGSLLNPWAFNPISKLFSEKFCTKRLHDCGEKFHSTAKDSKYFVLRPYNWFYQYFDSLNYCFVPTIDKAFITDRPEVIVNGPLINDVPLLIGFTSMETSTLDFESSFKINNPLNKEQKLINEYLASIADNAGLLRLRNIIDIEHGVREFAKSYSRKSSKNVYLYKFSFVGELNKNSMGKGAAHGDDLKYLYGSKDNGTKLFDSDIRIQRKMVDMWSNFIKYGNPTPNRSRDCIKIWRPFALRNLYLNIDKRLTFRKLEMEEPYVAYNAIYSCVHLTDCQLLRKFLTEKGLWQ